MIAVQQFNKKVLRPHTQQRPWLDGGDPNARIKDYRAILLNYEGIAIELSNLRQIVDQRADAQQAILQSGDVA